MKRIYKQLFPFLESQNLMESRLYLSLFSTIIFIITGFFSYQFFELYSPKLYQGVYFAFPIWILGILLLLYLTTISFIIFILIPFSFKFIFIQEPLFQFITIQYKPNKNKIKRKTHYIILKFKGPLSTIIRC